MRLAAPGLKPKLPGTPRSPFRRRACGRGERGLGILGIIVVLALIGALVGWGSSLLRHGNRPEAATTSADYLDEARRALFIYVKGHGSFPFADTNGDGQPDAGSLAGTLPYAVLGVKPGDSWDKSVSYWLNPDIRNPLNPGNPGLTSTNATAGLRKNDTCRALKALATSSDAVRLTIEKTTLHLQADAAEWSTVIPSGSVLDVAAPDATTLYGWLIKNDPPPAAVNWLNCSWP